MNSKLFEVKGLSWVQNDCTILKDIVLTIPANKIVGIIGPNGAGKTSLLNCLHGQVVPTKGEILFESEQIDSIPLKKRAQKIAYISQHYDLTFDVSVNDVVASGRLPHSRLFSFLSKTDEDIVEKALDKTGLKDYKLRQFSTLSGGEKQRVLMAKVLAQKANVLLLDEPTNHLDIHHQLKLIDDIKEFNNRGGSVILTIHDLRLASEFCDYLILINDGQVYDTGRPSKVLTKENINHVYNVNTVVENQNDALHMTFTLASKSGI